MGSIKQLGGVECSVRRWTDSSERRRVGQRLFEESNDCSKSAKCRKSGTERKGGGG